MKCNHPECKAGDKIKDQESLIESLLKVGSYLSLQKDTSKLLDTIVSTSMKLTNSDAGSLYIREGNFLRFKIAKNTSRHFPFNEFQIPLTKESIAGYCALSGDSYNFSSVDSIPDILGIKYNDSFDKKVGYKTVNMLVVPMKNLKGEIIGVLQLLNKKNSFARILDTIDDFKDHISSYTSHEERIISSLSSSAAIILERRKLYGEIKELFKTFSQSMVTTIDSRDPATAGHSIRVANYASNFANAINGVDYGKYRFLTFSEEKIEEIYYAALLHDVGKIGVKESILLKEDRLTKDEIESIKYKLSYLKKDIEFKIFKSEQSKDEDALFEKIGIYMDFLEKMSKKSFMSDEDESLLDEISRIEFHDIKGKTSKILTEKQLDSLKVKRGNLSLDERSIMEKHPHYTHEILKSISWGKELKDLPYIAACHHEKINGKGYPYSLKDEEIPVQSKILAIVDIYDALTASDRPYKPALSVEKTLSILEEEAGRNHIDKELLDIFINEKVYQLGNK